MHNVHWGSSPQKTQEKQGVTLPPTYLETSEPRSKHMYQETKCKWGREQKYKLTTGVFSHEEEHREKAAYLQNRMI